MYYLPLPSMEIYYLPYQVRFFKDRNVLSPFTKLNKLSKWDKTTTFFFPLEWSIVLYFFSIFDL